MNLLKTFFACLVLFPLSLFASKQKPMPSWWIEKAGDAKQMIWVKPTKSSNAELVLYELDENGSWKIALQTKAKIGKNGIAAFDKKTLTDGKTPQGLYTVGSVYGRTPLFYLSLPYNQIESGTSWETLPSDINLFINYDEAKTKADPQHALVIHDWGNKKQATPYGAIAIDKEALLKLVTTLKKDSNPKIAIGTADPSLTPEKTK